MHSERVLLQGPDARAADGLVTGEVLVSVVIPVYNERESIPVLYENIRTVLDGLGKPWELVFVDDGSRDGSFEVMRSLYLRDGRVTVVRLRRNFGQTPALAAGFDHARGKVVITLDGDLQNDPADIPRLLTKLEEGFDIVSGWRRARHDPVLTKVLPSMLSNRLASWLTGVSLHDHGCTLKAYRREIIQGIHLYGELHRYIAAIASSVGARVAEVEVRHHPRRLGRSKYGWTRLVRGLLDLIAIKLLLSYMTRPMQIFGGMGLLLLALAGLSLSATLFMKLVAGLDVTGNPLLYLAMLCFITSVQFFSLGFLGEISIRTYHETQRKPIYVVREVLGNGAESAAP